MLGRTHRDLETIRPLQDGVIADFKMTDGMLQGFINKINNADIQGQTQKHHQRVAKR